MLEHFVWYSNGLTNHSSIYIAKPMLSLLVLVHLFGVLLFGKLFSTTDITLSFTIASYSLVDFLIARIMMSQPSVLALS